MCWIRCSRMNHGNLRFTLETQPFGADILALSAAHPLGAEIFTYQTAAPENCFGQLWAGLDGAGRLAAALYAAGEARTLLAPDGGRVEKAPAVPFDLSDEIAPEDRLVLLEKTIPAPDMPQGIAEIKGCARVWEMLGLLHGAQPPQAAESRYVYTLRAMNAGLSDAFGVTDGTGALCAVARITAKNRRYALIGDVFTKTGCRGRGYAARLLTACEARAAATGLKSVLYCYPEMARFYLARGYRSLNANEV